MLSRPQGEDAGARDDVAGHAWSRPSLGALPVAPTLVRLSSSHAGVPEGEPLALAAQVVSLGPDLSPATGEVAFLVDGRRIGDARLDDAGPAVLDGLHLEVGVHAVMASYSGDAQHAAATSAPLPQAVTAAATSVVLLLAAPVVTRDGTVLEAELVDPAPGRRAADATGELVVSAGLHELASVPLQAGLARVVVPAVPPGRLRVSYAGDREHSRAEGTLPLDGPAAEAVSS